MSSTHWLPFSRSHTCDEIDAERVGDAVRLMGWVARVRNLGGLRFMDLRDRFATVQLIADPADAALDEITRSLRMEDVIAVEGVVQARPPEMARDDSPAGAVEVSVSRVVVLNKSQVVPFMIAVDAKA